MVSYKTFLHNAIKSFADGNAEGAQNFVLANSTRSERLDSLQQVLPFLKSGELITGSEYRLSALDLMELLIVLLEKEISAVKLKQALTERDEKLKDDKKAQKAKKTVRKK